MGFMTYLQILYKELVVSGLGKQDVGLIIQAFDD